jgi:hypothetical protein
MQMSLSLQMCKLRFGQPSRRRRDTVHRLSWFGPRSRQQALEDCPRSPIHTLKPQEAPATHSITSAIRARRKAKQWPHEARCDTCVPWGPPWIEAGPWGGREGGAGGGSGAVSSTRCRMPLGVGAAGAYPPGAGGGRARHHRLEAEGGVADVPISLLQAAAGVILVGGVGGAEARSAPHLSNTSTPQPTAASAPALQAPLHCPTDATTTTTAAQQ